jgi:catechol 2,3-dioxygenase-like lactoylglutathione lyase family enzyme
MLKSAVPILASLNAEETIQFYTEKLGFKFINNWDGYVIFSRDEISIHLWPTNDPELPKATACYIYVSEVDSLYNEYKKLGIVHPNGKLEVKAWKLKQFSVLDNNGNLINFGEPV